MARAEYEARRLPKSPTAAATARKAPALRFRVLHVRMSDNNAMLYLQKLMDVSMGSSLYLSECESDLEQDQSLMGVSFQLQVEQLPDDRGMA